MRPYSYCVRARIAGIRSFVSIESADSKCSAAFFFSPIVAASIPRKCATGPQQACGTEPSTMFIAAKGRSCS